MSSLAAARADGFYHPPEYRAEHGSLNKFRGSHALGVRAKKINEGILVIRFEMPFKVWCTTCESIVAKGVRFNAEKKCVGKYYTTSIYEFTMKCYHCDNKYKIRTDPAECEYKLIEGLRLKVEEYDPEDAVTIRLPDDEAKAKLAGDTMATLEHREEGERKARGKNKELQGLKDLGDTRSDTFSVNSQLRSYFRKYKKEAILQEIEDAKPKNFAMPVLEESTEDKRDAQRVVFKTDTPRAQRHSTRAAIEGSSIFSNVNSKRLRNVALEGTAPKRASRNSLISSKSYERASLAVKRQRLLERN